MIVTANPMTGSDVSFRNASCSAQEFRGGRRGHDDMLPEKPMSRREMTKAVVTVWLVGCTELLANTFK